MVVTEYAVVTGSGISGLDPAELAWLISMIKGYSLIRFDLIPPVSKIQGCRKSEVHRMISLTLNTCS